MFFKKHLISQPLRDFNFCVVLGNTDVKLVSLEIHERRSLNNFN